MSRPRKPFGPNPPGRLPATMIKVLAAELSDAGRLSRGKRYWADSAVLDISIGHGAVTAEIQGSRSTPYVVTISVGEGTGVPRKRDVWCRCTCPDDGIEGACKHAVAALFALSDEIAVEPGLLDRLRSGSGVTQLAAHRHERPHAADPGLPSGRQSERPLADVVSIHSRRGGGSYDDADARPDVADLDDHADDHDRLGERGRGDVGDHRRTVTVDPAVAQVARLLIAPSGASAPDFPPVSPLDHTGISDTQLAATLHDALDQLRIDWG